MKKEKNVWYLSLTSFFTDMSSEMIFPILPLFMANVLGLSKSFIGLVEGVALSTASILKVFSGYISDKLKMRKPLVVAGYSLSSIAKPLFAIAANGWHVLILRFTERLGKGIRDAPRDALIKTSSKKHGRAFGLQRAMDTFGAVIGVLLAIILLNFFEYRQIFALSIIPAIIAVFILITFVKEEGKLKKKYELKSLKQFPKSFKLFLAASIIFALANFSYAFYLLKVQDLGVKIVLIPAVYLLYNIIYAIFSYPAGRLSDKIGRKKVIIAGYLMFVAVSFGFAFTSQAILAWLLFAFYGLQIAFIDGVSRAFISDLAPKGKEGTAFGIYHTSIGLAALPSSIIAGTIWDLFGSPATFIYGGVLALLATLILYKVRS